MKRIGHWLLIACQLFQVTAIQAQQDREGVRANGTREIPFQLGAGYLILIEGRIGKLEKLKFVVDTGASQSVVNRRIADKLGLAREAGGIFKFQQFAAVEWAVFPEVEFGPIDVRNARLMVDRLAQPSTGIGDVDAIVGLDLLGLSRGFLLDYEAKTIQFSTGPDLQPKKVTCLTVEVLLQGHPVNLVADTGMHGILLYEDSLRRRFPKLNLKDEKKGVRIGQLFGTQAKLDRVRLGASESQVTVYLIKRPSEGLPDDIDGYLGMDALNAQWIEFDFEAKRLRW